MRMGGQLSNGLTPGLGFRARRSPKFTFTWSETVQGVHLPDMQPEMAPRKLMGFEDVEVVPVIIFFHCGSSAHSSANSSIYDTLCRRLVGICNVVVVSVNYRCSPENRYPCTYEDGWLALKWVNSRPWLQSGKESKVHIYLAGDSLVDNIVHHVALKARESGIQVMAANRSAFSSFSCSELLRMKSSSLSLDSLSELISPLFCLAVAEVKSTQFKKKNVWAWGRGQQGHCGRVDSSFHHSVW
uniref:Alpha/beta hydrolase fold-3 domain-containing protein n=1 Tax=Nelumbo nucifera TaxID=4432 RepID=A0A822ZAM1_NELNU|nr:TPA_asm: hypothetical protein HUJ06_015946 [Nelumbo nucifera]